MAEEWQSEKGADKTQINLGSALRSSWVGFSGILMGNGSLLTEVSIPASCPCCLQALSTCRRRQPAPTAASPNEAVCGLGHHFTHISCSPSPPQDGNRGTRDVWCMQAALGSGLVPVSVLSACPSCFPTNQCEACKTAIPSTLTQLTPLLLPWAQLQRSSELQEAPQL